MPARGRPRRCAAALALALALAPGPARAGPSERDLAYERALQAEEAGDHERAAAAYERAYVLTAPGESGPRLLFLRAVITAHLHGDGGTEAGRAHLCRARELLRAHLGDGPPTTPDPLAPERTRLSEVESRLAGADCNPPEPDPPTPIPDEPAPSPTRTANSPSSPITPTLAPAPAPAPLVPRPARSPTRALWISGGASLGLGAASFALMGAGVVIGRRKGAEGNAACRDAPQGCDSNSSTIRDVVTEGRRSEQFVRAGAVLGSIAVLAGVTLLAIAARSARSTRSARSARIMLTPRLAPGWLGLGLSGRF